MVPRLELIAAIRADNSAAAARVKSLATGKPGSVAVLPLYGIINQRAIGRCLRAVWHFGAGIHAAVPPGRQ